MFTRIPQLMIITDKKLPKPLMLLMCAPLQPPVKCCCRNQLLFFQKTINLRPLPALPGRNRPLIAKPFFQRPLRQAVTANIPVFPVLDLSGIERMKQTLMKQHMSHIPLTPLMILRKIPQKRAFLHTQGKSIRPQTRCMALQAGRKKQMKHLPEIGIKTIKIPAQEGQNTNVQRLWAPCCFSRFAI